jgi:hypothetical protein
VSADLLQQVDELVSGQPLEHGEVGQLRGVGSVGRGHGAVTWASVLKSGSPLPGKGRRQPGDRRRALSRTPRRGGPEYPEMRPRSEWPLPGRDSRSRGVLASGLQPQCPTYPSPAHSACQQDSRQTPRQACGECPASGRLARSAADFPDLPEVAFVRPALRVPGRGRHPERDISKPETSRQLSSVIAGEREAFPR